MRKLCYGKERVFVPGQVIGGVLPLRVVLAVQVGQQALHLAVPVVALLLQHLEVRDVLQVERDVRFAEQPPERDVAHAERVWSTVLAASRVLWLDVVLQEMPEFLREMLALRLVVGGRGGRQVARPLRLRHFVVELRHELPHEFPFGQVLAIGQTIVVPRINHLNKRAAVRQLPQN